MSTEVSKERADEIDAAWQAASMTERLSMPRLQWLSVGDGDTKFWELRPTTLEVFAADRIAKLEEALREMIQSIPGGAHCDPQDVADIQRAIAARAGVSV